MQNNSDHFYEELPSFNEFEKFTDLSLYKEVPADWFVAIADVQNSTNEIQAGRYKEVNSVGAACIAAVINAVQPLIIPFVFGGDGAAFCIPSSQKSKVESALLASKIMAHVEFKMKLRIGLVTLNELKKKGSNVLVAKYQPSEYYQQAMFSGNGISVADKLVKNDKSTEFLIDENIVKPEGSFDGFECRWNEIPSPSEETISIIVQSISDEKDSSIIYSEIINRITQLYGDEEKHRPIRKELLSLSFSFKKLCSEAAIRTTIGNNIKRILYIIKLIILNLTGKWFMYKNKKTKNTDWGKYKERLVTNTDFRKFDDSLRMVISGTKVQRARLVFYLEQLHQKEKIVYGTHSSTHALMTCLVEDYNHEHVHFLDSSNGGYALAAVGLKKQLTKIK